LPGVKENGFYETAWKYYQAHPNGPYIYGGWDPIPPNVAMRPAHARWLKRYLPLVEGRRRRFWAIRSFDPIGD
jgi:hypothetical protein